MMTVTDDELVQLLRKAEQSLAEHLAIQPDSHNKKLLELYAHVKEGTTPAFGFPDARHLFWDTPEDPIEEQCLSDALAVFQFVRGQNRV